MKLTRLIKENEQPRPLSPQVKKHFLEIISTYNKYQEMMDRKSDITEVAEVLGGITEAAKTLLLGESDDWFDKVTIKRNLNELDKLGKEFDKCATEANSLDQRLHGLYEDMGHILNRYYKMGEITQDQMKERLGIRESITEAGEDVNKAIIPADVKIKLQKAIDMLNAKKLTYPQKLQVMGRVLDALGIDKKELNKSTAKLRNKLESKVNEKAELIRLGEEVEKLMEKNCPTDPEKWSASKSAAKAKFDVYPSAYANGWASKNYKEKGGGWRKCKD
jgi:hypothetical protein